MGIWRQWWPLEPPRLVNQTLLRFPAQDASPRALQFLRKFLGPCGALPEGYNAASKEYEDLLEAGVLDPARVTRSALINAASISGLMLTTDVMITKIDEEEHGAKIQGAVR